MTTGRMHDGEVVLDEAAVAALVAGQFPHWADLPVTHLSSAGTDNAMFRLGDSLTVRLPRIEWATGGVEREARWLPVIGPRLPVDTPQPLALGEPANGYPWRWAVVTYLDGATPTGRDLTEDFVRGVAHCLNVLHAVDVPDGPVTKRGFTFDTRDEETRRSIVQMRGMPGIDADAVTALWDEAFELPTIEPPGTWIHSDIAPGNLLLRGGSLTGLVDWAGVGRGDPAVDVCVAWNLLPARLRPAFREALDIDEATWLRSRAWSLSQACLQLPYYVETNKPLAAQARHVIAEVLADAGLS